MESLLLAFILYIVIAMLIWQALKRSNEATLWFLVTKMPSGKIGIISMMVLGAVTAILVLKAQQPAFAFITLLAWLPNQANGVLYNRLKGDTEQLLEYYNYFVARFPTVERNYYLRASAYLKIGDPERALTDYSTIAELIDEPKVKKTKRTLQPLGTHNRALLKFFMIAAYWQMREYEYCVAEAEAALSAPHLPATNQALFYVNLAASNMELGHLHEAINELNQAQNLMVNSMPVEASAGNFAVDSMILLNQSLAHYRLGDMDNAIRCWQMLNNRGDDYADSERIKNDYKWSPTWHIDAMLDMNKRLKAMS
ncbi:MAG: hypothetical protein H6670_00075 [Anaerolineaceae bacterium]|nr:hypothetical protein [Anaerolineaceae bacterium]